MAQRLPCARQVRATQTLSYVSEGAIFLYVGMDTLDPLKWKARPAWCRVCRLATDTAFIMYSILARIHPIHGHGHAGPAQVEGAEPLRNQKAGLVRDGWSCSSSRCMHRPWEWGAESQEASW